MNYKKILLIIAHAVWVCIATLQQIYWISQGTYNFFALVWYAIIVLTPYFVYKYWD